MREIKLRYRCLNNKTDKVETFCYTIDQVEGGLNLEKGWIFGGAYKLLSRDLFTGLKDNNGKEIYEGDIVKVDFDGEEQTIHTVYYGIEYDYPAFDLDPDLDCDCNNLQHCICSGSTTIEVIGNIYENKELLK